MTPKVKIVTDSSAYPEPEIIKKYDIQVVPIKVAFGTEVFAEGVDITNEEFYQRLTKTSAFPTTSQPSVGDFVKVYSELAQQGHPILSIHISSAMSGTVSSALSAKSTLPQAQIEIVDSRTLAMGMIDCSRRRSGSARADAASNQGFNRTTQCKYILSWHV